MASLTTERDVADNGDYRLAMELGGLGGLGGLGSNTQAISTVQRKQSCISGVSSIRISAPPQSYPCSPPPAPHSPLPAPWSLVLGPFT